MIRRSMLRLSFILLPIFTALSMFLLCLSLFSRHWENIRYDLDTLRGIQDWRRIVRIPNDTDQYFYILVPRSEGGSSWKNDNGSTLMATRRYGGLWEICNTFTDSVYEGKPLLTKCQGYLDIYHTTDAAYSLKTYRIMMQLTRSAEMCGIVAMLLVSLGLILGLMSVVRHQVICALIAGISILVAACYEVFTICLMLIRGSNLQDSAIGADTFVDNESVMPILETKVTENGWSMAVMWASCGCCIITSFLWIIVFNILQKDAANELMKYPQMCAA